MGDDGAGEGFTFEFGACQFRKVNFIRDWWAGWRDDSVKYGVQKYGSVTGTLTQVPVLKKTNYTRVIMSCC